MLLPSRVHLRVPLLLGLLTLAGCTADRAPAERGIVDSVVPMDTALARFREGMTEPVGLSGGAPSREALVREFLRAVAETDTAAVRQLILTRAEFAWLYYPTAHLAQPPNDLPPDILWMMIRGESERGIGKALGVLSGRPSGYLDHACDPTLARTEGDNRIHAGCVVRRIQDGDTLPERLFGLIVERDGVFKFLSYANRL
jgi:hypothetical protein